MRFLALATLLTFTQFSVAVSFTIKFDPALRNTPASGRLVVYLLKADAHPIGANQPADGPFISDPQPLFGIDVKDLAPSHAVTIDDTADSFPEKLSALPPGDYSAQAVLDMHRDHVRWNSEPGNLFSDPVAISIPPSPSPGTPGIPGTHGRWNGRGEDSSASARITLSLTHVVPPRSSPKLDLVQLLEIHSKLLSNFRGHDVTLRAAIIPPIDYDPHRSYPAVYEIVGFAADHFQAFSIESARRRLYSDSPLHELYRNAFIIVPDPQGPSGHTLFANSDVNGPCADALITELLPAIEARYPLIRDPSARLLRGHSSGGWAALWLTTQYPKTFGACWAYAPDPVDFHHLERVDIYKQDNAYIDRDSPPGSPISTPSFHLHDAITCTVRDENREEEIVGPHNSSPCQWDSWQAVFGHRDAAGNPVALFDLTSGKINRDEAEYYKRKDITELLRSDPTKYLPIFRERCHILVGADDSYYLADPVQSLIETINSIAPSQAGDGYVKIIPDADHLHILSTLEALNYPLEMLTHLRRYKHLPEAH